CLSLLFQGPRPNRTRRFYAYRRLVRTPYKQRREDCASDERQLPNRSSLASITPVATEMVAPLWAGISVFAPPRLRGTSTVASPPSYISVKVTIVPSGTALPL